MMHDVEAQIFGGASAPIVPPRRRRVSSKGGAAAAPASSKGPCCYMCRSEDVPYRVLHRVPTAACVCHLCSACACDMGFTRMWAKSSHFCPACRMQMLRVWNDALSFVTPADQDCSVRDALHVYLFAAMHASSKDRLIEPAVALNGVSTTRLAVYWPDAAAAAELCSLSLPGWNVWDECVGRVALVAAWKAMGAAGAAVQEVLDARIAPTKSSVRAWPYPMLNVFDDAVPSPGSLVVRARRLTSPEFLAMHNLTEEDVEANVAGPIRDAISALYSTFGVAVVGTSLDSVGWDGRGIVLSLCAGAQGSVIVDPAKLTQAAHSCLCDMLGSERASTVTDHLTQHVLDVNSALSFRKPWAVCGVEDAQFLATANIVCPLGRMWSDDPESERWDAVRMARSRPDSDVCFVSEDDPCTELPLSDANTEMRLLSQMPRTSPMVVLVKRSESVSAVVSVPPGSMSASDVEVRKGDTLFVDYTGDRLFGSPPASSAACIGVNAVMAFVAGRVSRDDRVNVALPCVDFGDALAVDQTRTAISFGKLDRTMDDFRISAVLNTGWTATQIFDMLSNTEDVPEVKRVRRNGASETYASQSEYEYGHYAVVAGEDLADENGCFDMESPDKCEFMFNHIVPLNLRAFAVIMGEGITSVRVPTKKLPLLGMKTLVYQPRFLIHLVNDTGKIVIFDSLTRLAATLPPLRDGTQMRSVQASFAELPDWSDYTLTTGETRLTNGDLRILAIVFCAAQRKGGR